MPLLHIKLWQQMVIPIFVLLSLYDTAQGQNTNISTEVRPLIVGDTIPEELWQMPLKIVNDPEGRDTIRLNTYRNKRLIILDFWATWCAPCVKSLPDLLRLEDELSCKVLPLSDEPIEKILSFLDGRQNLHYKQFYNYSRKTILDKSFKRTTIPHTVVIVDGVIASITVPELLNKENLLTVLNTNTNLIPNKINLDTLETGLLGSLNSLSSTFPIGYTALFGEIKGLMPTTRWITSENNKPASFQIANHSLLSTLAILTQKGEIFLRNPNRIKVCEGSVTRSILQEELDYLNHTKICYEGRYLFNIDYLSALSKLDEDLLFYMGISVEIKEGSVEVEEYFNDRTQQEQLSTGTGYTMKQVVYKLNQELRLFPVTINSDNANTTIFLDTDINLMSAQQIEKSLKDMGWKKRRIINIQEEMILNANGFYSKNVRNNVIYK